MSGAVEEMAGRADAASRLPELLRAVWDRSPSPVGQVRGRWRWRAGGQPGAEVRELLSWRIPPGGIPLDPDRVRVISLEASRPGDRPCDVLLYPAPVEVASAADPEIGPTVYLLLFYSVHRPTGEPSAPERDRAYYRVVESLDRMHDGLAQLHPGRPIRAIDLPMPGWMLQALRPTTSNFCSLVPS